MVNGPMFSKTAGKYLYLLVFTTAGLFYLTSLKTNTPILIVVGVFFPVFFISILQPLCFALRPSAASTSWSVYTHEKIFCYVLALGLSSGAIAQLYSKPIISFGQDVPDKLSLLGTLSEDPRKTSSGIIISGIKLKESISSNQLRTSACGDIPCLLPASSSQSGKAFLDLPRGSEIKIDGEIKSGNLGQFIFVENFEILKSPTGLQKLRQNIRTKIINYYEQFSWGPMGLALLLGWRDGLNEDVELAFRAAGSSHVLALSGMHLAIFSGLLLFLLRRPCGLVISGILSILILLLYLWIVGAQSSLIRSFVMYALSVFLAIAGYRYRALDTLSISLYFHILLLPQSAKSPAFVLSYFALLGILLLSKPIDELLPKRLPLAMRGGFAASIAACIASLVPLSIFFGEIHPIGIVLSIPLAALAGLFMLMALFFLLLIPLPSLIINSISALVAFVYKSLCFIAKLGTYFPGIALPSLSLSILFTVLIVFAILFINYFIVRWRKNLAPIAQL